MDLQIKKILGKDLDNDKYINEFKEFLRDDRNSIDRILNKYLLFGVPYIYRDDEDTYFELKEEIAEHFKIQQTQIYIVGSARLGFSIAPHKRFKYFDEDSDIDVAIIDAKLFDQYWKKVYSTNFDVISMSEEEAAKIQAFKDYIFKGWLRPDFMPQNMRREWFEYFKGLYKKYNRHIAAGVYRDSDFFMVYHGNNITKLREEIKNGI